MTGRAHPVARRGPKPGLPVRPALVLAVLLAAGGCGTAPPPAADVADSRPGYGEALVGSSRPPVLRSEPHVERLAPVVVVEPAGLGPVDGIAPTASSTATSGATTVAHAGEGRVMAHAAPHFASERLAMFRNPDRRGAEVVFQVVGPVIDGWVEVKLPIRPNGTTGWIRTRGVSFTSNPYRIDVDVERFELTVTRGEEVVLTTPVGIGAGATPTPRGEFYLTELLRPSDPDGIYGPYAYGLSGYSDTLSSFNGGPGAIGIHGTNQPELLGTEVSHGCVRVENAVIEQLTTFLPLGTPVTIG